MSEPIFDHDRLDGEQQRFNKLGEALDTSYVNLSRYMQAADFAAAGRELESRIEAAKQWERVPKPKPTRKIPLAPRSETNGASRPIPQHRAT